MMQERETIFNWDQKFSKRSSGLFSVLKWFGNKESVSVPSPELTRSASSSCDSIESVFSTDTVASFAFVPPSTYKPFGSALQAEKFILSGPETSTYRARLAQREASRETDRNLTLRSKYNLYKDPEPDRGHSLPLMSKSSTTEEQGMHRRTASESSKHRRAGAYCHVKGKRKAPQPPGIKGDNTLRRKKRLAPQPPSDVICNDSLKLDHGILKPAKEQLGTINKKTDQIQEITQVSPRPWYKRTLSKSSTEKKTDQEKRKSGLTFLTNISELDREAMEIVGKENLKMKYLKPTNQVPAFMRPRGNEHVRTNSDSWILPKRKSARDLIARFNAITGVSKNSSHSEPKESIKEETPIVPQDKQEDIKTNEIQSSSSQSQSEKLPRCTAVVKPISRAQWNCPKCTLENDYWRIICRVCSTIKPYFDDFTSISTASSPLTTTKINMDDKVEKRDASELFDVNSRVSELQRSVFQSQNFNNTSNVIDQKQYYECDVLQQKIKKYGATKNSADKCFYLTDTENKLNISDKLKKIEHKDDFHKFSKVKIHDIQIEDPNLNLNKGPQLNQKKTVESINSNNFNLDKNVKSKDESPIKIDRNTKIEKMILGDELGFTNPNQEDKNMGNNSKTHLKMEKMILGDEIKVENPDYINIPNKETVNKASTADTNKVKLVDKNIFGDEIEAKNLSQNNKQNIKIIKTTTNNKDNDSSELLKIKKSGEDKISAKREEREKLKKMLIEMKNSLPKNKLTTPQNNENKRRVSLIQEMSEPEAEIEKEKTAEIIIATTETVYENIKVKCINADKPVKVSSSSQTNAVSRRNSSPEESSIIQDSSASFHLIKAKDFVDISNTKISDEMHTYANLNEPECSKTDTLEINRLSRRLENAIAGGELGHAAVFARELAQLKVPLSVVRQKSDESGDSKNDSFDVDMYVEDKISHRGPFPLQVTEKMTVAELKKLVEEKYKFPVGVQRWILGKQLATDDNASLSAHQISSTGCPIFLYLVAPANEPKTESNSVEIVEVNNSAPTKVHPSNIVYNIPIAIIEEDEQDNEEAEELEALDNGNNVQELWKCNACTLLNPTANNKCEICGLIRGEATSKSSAENQTYLQLMNLDNEELVRNVDRFECLVCFTECPPGDGVTLRECLHQFCRTCLAHTVEFSEEAEVKCPYRDEQYSCDIALQDREVKALVSSAVYDQHLAKSVKQAENKMNNTFHCKTPDCTGWCIYEDNINAFHCPVCRKNNCLTCQAIHTEMNCKQYQEKMKSQSETDEEARRTRNFLEDMIARGEALSCPTCQVVLLKKWGCDWLRCSMCKTEICWVTRGPRWGPSGKGDTSAGCKCGVNGIKCHPKCNYCH